MAQLSIHVSDYMDQAIRDAAAEQGVSISALLTTALDQHLNGDRAMPSSFDADDGGYSKTRFYSAGTDKRGHSERMQVRVPPTVAGEIAALVQSGRVPDYRTASDVIRDAIYHRLHDVEQMLASTGWKSRVTAARLLSELLAQTKAEEDADALADATRAALSKLYAKSDVFGVEKLVDEMMIESTDLSSIERGPLMVVLEEAKQWVIRVKNS